MRMTTLRRATLLMACFILAGACSAFGLGGYKDLLWIDHGGYIIHARADGETTMTPFVAYREVRYETNTRKPGHFVWTQDNIAKQTPVREIQNIKLKLSFEDLRKKPGTEVLRHVVVTMKNGMSFDGMVEQSIGDSLANDAWIEVKYLDPATETMEFGGIDGLAIREVVFN